MRSFVWYNALILVLVGAPTVLFIVGIRSLLRAGRRRNAAVRCMVFMVRLYLTGTVIAALYRTNWALEQAEREQAQRSESFK